MDILVINSDLEDRSVIQQVFEHGGHKFTFVENTEDGWKLISDGRFRFVIINVSSQGQDIYQLIRQAHTQSGVVGQTYFLILAKKGLNENITAALEAGADDFLNTPIIPQELKTRVAVGVRILFMGETLSNARNQLESLALYDTLTGLMNRQALHKVAQGELERARREANGISLIAMDVRNLSAINNIHGRTVGDDVLQAVAKIILEKSRPYDCIGRWKDDKFVIVLPGVVSSDAEKIVNRVLNGVAASQIRLLDETNLDVELNVGIASAQNINAYAEIDSFIESAIQALNNNKQNPEEKISVLFL